VYTGTPLHYEQTVRERVARPGRVVRRVETGTPVHYERTVRWVRVVGPCRTPSRSAPESTPPWVLC